jgi:hypothetical protein
MHRRIRPLTIRLKREDVRRQWRQCLVLQQALNKLNGRPRAGAASDLLRYVLANGRRMLEYKLRRKGVDYLDVLAAANLPREEPEPFRGVPVQVPRVLD